MKKYALCAWFCALVLVMPISVSAATYINAGDTPPSGTWNEAGSPYVISGDVAVAPSDALVIEPGTIIEVASPGQGSLFLTASSSLNGTADQPIVFDGLPYVMIGDGSISFSYVNLKATELEIMNATATMDHISSSGADTAFLFRKSAVVMSNVSISSSTYGVYSYYVRPVLMDARQSHWSRVLGSFISFIVPARIDAQTADDPGQNRITIHESSFESTHYAVYNATQNLIHAENDWWGSDDGPATSTSAQNVVYGPVSYDPWQGKSVREVCCSSVLFVPGLEASRLSIDKRRALGTSTDQLWEPLLNFQVKDLYLDASGDSIQPNIHPSGLVDSALAVQPIYEKFINTMKSLVAKGIIADWQAYPYDWRLALAKVSAGTIRTSTVVKTIENMASSSKTGKVTIIAHSNGGLVAKLLYNELKEKGEAGLVDKIVFVAVPEVGTPQAVPSLLHGDAEEIADGYIVSASTARGLGVNMASAYSLLPDQNYFSKVPQAVISFAGSTMAGFSFSKYFPAITSYSKMKSFITDSSHGSLSDSTDIPVRGNSALLPQAESAHSIMDSWKPASSTQLVAIAGWGLPTDIGVNYFQKMICAAGGFLHMGQNCSTELQYDDISTSSGDGTVVINSALYSSSTKKIFDEGDYDKENGKTLAHADMLEADPVISVITDSVENDRSGANIPYIYDAIPARSLGDELTIGIHSPATIDIYDTAGNHTGPIDNPIPGSDLDAYENKIPGSFYKEEGDQVYVTLPYSKNYSVDINGTGIGDVEVTTDVTDLDANKDIASSTFADIPVTPLTHMEFVKSAVANGADPYWAIEIDEDGDGTFDATSTPDSAPLITADSYKNAIRASIHALGLASTDEKRLLDRLDKAWKFAQNDRTGKAEKAFDSLESMRVHHLRVGKITDRDRTDMRSMIEGWFGDMGI